IQLSNISHTYTSTTGPICALNGLNFYIQENEFVTFVGPSGCGKSTLLHIVAGFVRPTEGTVRIQEEPVLRPGRARMVFQADAVFPWLSAQQNIEYGLRHSGLSETDRRGRVTGALTAAGLTDFATKWPRE